MDLIMSLRNILVVLLFFSPLISGLPRPQETIAEEERRINLWLNDLDTSLVKRMYEDSQASWTYEANLTDFNLEKMNNLTVTSAKFYKVSRISLAKRLNGAGVKVLMS